MRGRQTKQDEVVAALNQNAVMKTMLQSSVSSLTLSVNYVIRIPSIPSETNTL